jgi:predicted class III extradiol MEMO1 family dioxygenase
VDHDVEGFAKYLEETDNTICGRHPIGVLLECLKESNNLNLKSQLVKYD